MKLSRFKIFPFVCVLSALGYSCAALAMIGGAIDAGLIRDVIREREARQARLITSIIDADDCRRLLGDEIDAKGNRTAGQPIASDLLKVGSQPVLRIRHQNAPSPHDVDAQMVLMHGLGMNYSGPTSWAQHIAALTVTAEKPKGGSTASFLRSLPRFQSMAVEAVDLPGSASATPTELIEYSADIHSRSELSVLVNHIAGYLRDVRRRNPKIPLFVVARSAYGRILPEVNRQFPGLIDKMVLISPTYPGGVARDRAQLLGAEQEAAESGTAIKHSVTDWFFRITNKINWQIPRYFGQTPTLIMTGSLDTQVTNEDRGDLRSLADHNYNLRYVEFAAEHDVLKTSGKLKVVGRSAWTELMNFLSPSNRTQQVDAPYVLPAVDSFGDEPYRL